MKKKTVKFIAMLALALVLAFAAVFTAGCGEAYITSMTAGEAEGTYILTYSDGRTETIILPGRNGTDGKDGADGKDVTITDIYNTYIEKTGEEIAFADFIDKYLSIGSVVSADNSAVIAECLQSVAKVYTEFVELVAGGGMFARPVHDVAIYTGSAVIWSIDEASDGYTYLVTNGHVIYDSSAVTQANGGNIARKVYCYLYGSESGPTTVDKNNDGRADTDGDGYTAYDYGDYGVRCEIVGYTLEKDIAVIRAKTRDLKAVNPDIKAVELADGYHVGETAIAIGNPEDEGISVTEGIVSVDNENIELRIDTTRTYRSIRIDTALYGGNSGGGLFNGDGKLIGIANAGSSQDENINYAIPLEIVRAAVENILYYADDGNAATSGVYKITMGVTVLAEHSRYVYDKTLGYGVITEDVTVQEITENSIASKFGIAAGDVIRGVVINGNTFAVHRNFDVSDIILTMRPGDEIALFYERGSDTHTSASVRLEASDFEKLS